MSWVLGQLAIASVMIGVAVFIVDYSIDGFSLKRIADEWATISGEQAESKLLVADAVLSVLRGTVLSSLMWLFGPSFLMLGIALACDVGPGRSLGWIAVGTGGGTFLAGIAAYARVVSESLVEPFLPSRRFAVVRVLRLAGRGGCRHVAPRTGD